MPQYATATLTRLNPPLLKAAHKAALDAAPNDDLRFKVTLNKRGGIDIHVSVANYMPNHAKGHIKHIIEAWGDDGLLLPPSMAYAETKGE